jgi:hypothetical protein
MRLQARTALFTAIGMLCGTCRADFKYSETTKVTGGAMMGAVKFVSVFSKNAKQAMAPTTRTVAIKGNKLREENSDGKIQIIDLDNRRFIEIDPQAKTYGIMTFDEMKQAMQRKQQEVQAKMKEEQAKHPDNAQKTNVKITPKFESSETGATRTILGLPTKEVKAKVEMLMESDDPKTQGQQVSTVVNTDQWIAEDVPGYSEIRQFYLKIAKEMDWVPGQVMQGMGNSNVQVSLAELRKSNVAHITGMPIVSYTSMTLGGNTAAGQPAAQQAPPPPPPQKHDDDAIPTTASGAVMKGLGGMFKKKKEQQQQQQQQEQQASGAPTPASTPGSLMDMQTEVTNYSSDSLDAALFGPPSGYTQTQKSADDVLSGGTHK